MNDAEKALAFLINYSRFNEGAQDERREEHGAAIEIIRHALQHAAECEKQKDEAIECAKLWMNKHRAPKDKAQGLVKALEIILDRYQTVMDKFNHGELYYREDVWKAQKAISAFKADET